MANVIILFYICIQTKNIQMKIRAVITVLLLLVCYVGQRTQPAVTEAHCCFLPPPSLRWNLFWPGDFSRSLLERCLESGFHFFFFFTPFSLHLFHIFPPQLWLEALCSLYIWLSYFHECDIPQAHGGNFITCHKCPFGLKDELIRILWSEAQGRCNLTNTLLNTQLLVTCQILSF